MGDRARIKLEDFDVLFNNASSDMENELFTFGHSVQRSQIPIEILNIDEIEGFPDHPFKVIDDDEMEELSKSILETGVLNPVIVRRISENKYQMISGHRRLYACRKVGMTTIPGRVLTLSDDQATVLMIDANFLQRKVIRPSEKAKAYRKKYEAMKHPGRHGNVKDTYAEIGKATGESGKTVQRFSQLCNLSEELLEMVDNKRLGLSAAFELAFLSEDDQEILYDLLASSNVKIKKANATKIKDLADREGLTESSLMEAASSEEQAIKKVLNEGRIRAYFPTDISISEIEDTIVELLIQWKGV